LLLRKAFWKGRFVLCQKKRTKSIKSSRYFSLVLCYNGNLSEFLTKILFTFSPNFFIILIFSLPIFIIWLIFTSLIFYIQIKKKVFWHSQLLSRIHYWKFFPLLLHFKNYSWTPQYPCTQSYMGAFFKISWKFILVSLQLLYSRSKSTCNLETSSSQEVHKNYCHQICSKEIDHSCAFYPAKLSKVSSRCHLLCVNKKFSQQKLSSLSFREQHSDFEEHIIHWPKYS